MWNKQAEEQTKRDKPRDRILTIENTLIVTRGWGWGVQGKEETGDRD